MKALLIKVFGVNYTTNIPGLLAAICGASSLLDLLPAEYLTKAMETCVFLSAIGVIAAKSSNVTNAATPTPSKITPPMEAPK